MQASYQGGIATQGEREGLGYTLARQIVFGRSKAAHDGQNVDAA